MKVSRIGFGGAPAGIPKYLGPEDRDSPEFQENVLAALRQALESGVTYFDTAPGYGDGRAERLYGQALEPRRDSIVLATKYFYDDGWTPEKGTARLKESLDRLKTGTVDVLQYHGSFFNDELADRIVKSGPLDWADEMRAKGYCRHLGITAEAPSGGLERLLRTGRFETVLVAYNLIYQCWCDYQREPVGLIPLARSLGLGIAVMRPATSGFLQKLLAGEFPGVDAARVARLAINFVLSTPEVDCAVVGMRNPREVADNVALADDPAARLNVRELHDRFD